ncbi:tRNA (guanosine(46)-N7)-methyltransferase TrmB [Propionimicrobium lymphophilum]|uniref:tRNA (guanosine(46)-N7)-methyltransferase TrmB n=1 Tax=Propionimicrobium lymphophilum TaxID=33012 RepID=UPI002550DE20|nr:tRNA (guanosine(46)-N7)-methyltransferase TrmB [Propionimicrobium lymphophilum]MDK7709760.1 tRNA (guanosine(46)-N7)-methyltransferase TrmB [Propionimicrobium lymphophilum]MDK7733978.1 tRNA (guanosine(46)-N7)-methyltransferase TrmB [Propionimicrobium lymphophilum]
MRSIVSYVRRSPRMTPSQWQALERGRTNFGIAVPSGERETTISTEASINLDKEFGRSADLVVEIGCGMGDSLIPMASARPEKNFLAFEVYQRALGAMCAKVEKAGLTNIRFIEADGVQGLYQLIADGQLSELWTYFPDPWHKKRHHKRRLVNPEFAEVVAAKLSPGGRWWLATDWPEYAHVMKEVLDGNPNLRNAGTLDGGWADREDRPVTKFERRGIEAGRPIRDLMYVKTN